MDEAQAKFLLSSFRPDGADAHVPEFADALKLAAENRELGEWLAQERAADATFAQALNSVPIPDGLRDEILAVLAYDGKTTDVDAELDGLFTGGMVSIEPPEGLRDQILAAMEVERGAVEDKEEKASDMKVWAWLSVAAIAASVAVVTLVTQDKKESSEPLLVDDELVRPRSTIGEESIRTVAVASAIQQMALKLQSPEEIELNTNLDCANAAIQFLGTKDHPVPAQFPAGLEDAKLVGVRDMYLDSGQPISLLCFEKEGLGMVHLLVVDSSSLSDSDKLTSMKSISLKSCYNCNSSNFSIAHWREGEKSYMILTKAAAQEMVTLF